MVHFINKVKTPVYKLSLFEQFVLNRSSKSIVYKPYQAWWEDGDIRCLLCERFRNTADGFYRMRPCLLKLDANRNVYTIFY